MGQSDKTEHRGGKRPGAGRPRTGSKLYTFRAPEEMVPAIEGQQNKTDFILGCIESTLRKPAVDIPWVDTAAAASNVREMSLPFFDIDIVAGFPVPLDTDEKGQDIELLQMLCPHPESSYLIRVKGLSMIDAGIQDGDIIIVDKSNRNPTENEVAVCEFNGEYTIKYYRVHDGHGWLVPANPDYPEIPIGEGDRFSVWGVVTYVIHKA